MTSPFRNVNVDSQTPVAEWPLEAIRSALERGNLTMYGRLVHEVKASPWGPAARRIEDVLSWTQPYGVTSIMLRAIDRARDEAKAREREWVVTQLRAALDRSGLSQADFAKRLGTSQSRLSTYLNGSVVPAATLLARAQSIANARPS